MDPLLAAVPPSDPNDLDRLFTDLKRYCQDHHHDTAKPGFGGMWSAEENRGDDRLRFMMSDGGYNQYLISVTHGFRLREGFTHTRGNFIDLEQGTLEQVQACHRDLGLSATAPAIAVPAVPPSPGLTSEASSLLDVFHEEPSRRPGPPGITPSSR